MRRSRWPRDWGKYVDALNEAGIETKTARGFWGGVTPDGDLVVTAWTDQPGEPDRFYIWRPHTNHGGLKTAWEMGRIRPGAEVTLIVVRQRGNIRPGEHGRQVAAAALMPGRWKVVKGRPPGDEEGAVVEAA